MATYTTTGPVRGDCGHDHQTMFAAEKCRAKDDRGCKRHGAYSDRRIVRTDGHPFTEIEWDEYDHLNETVWA